MRQRVRMETSEPQVSSSRPDGCWDAPILVALIQVSVKPDSISYW